MSRFATRECSESDGVNSAASNPWNATSTYTKKLIAPLTSTSLELSENGNRGENGKSNFRIVFADFVLRLRCRKTEYSSTHFAADRSIRRVHPGNGHTRLASAQHLLNPSHRRSLAMSASQAGYTASKEERLGQAGVVIVGLENSGTRPEMAWQSILARTFEGGCCSSRCHWAFKQCLCAMGPSKSQGHGLRTPQTARN